jgi:hypothetical protein
VPGSLTVDLNRERLHDVDVVGSFSTTGPFTVDLTNHGGAVHVHLHLDDDLSRVASLDGGNHYVEPNATRKVEISVAQVDEPVRGKLKVVTGHGTETRYVTVTVEPRPVTERAVDVDESLSKPQRREQTEESEAVEMVRDLLQTASIPVVVLALFAVLVALAVASFVNSLAVLVGVAIVFVGVGVGLWLAFG